MYLNFIIVSTYNFNFIKHTNTNQNPQNCFKFVIIKVSLEQKKYI